MNSGKSRVYAVDEATDREPEDKPIQQIEVLPAKLQEVLPSSVAAISGPMAAGAATDDGSQKPLRKLSQPRLWIKSSLQNVVKSHKIEVMKMALTMSENGFQYDLHCIQARLKLIADRETNVITPNCTFCKRWDVVMICLLAFTAFVTPMEVAFITGETKIDALFVINRIVDLFFTYDLWINFNLGYYDKKQMVCVTDLPKIRWHYFSGWFLVDFVSLIPFEILGMIKTSSSSAFKDMKVLRALKLLKLVKLLRILRSSRLVNRMQLAIGLSFAAYSLAKFSVIVVSVLHWTACIWRMVPDLEQADNNWIVASVENGSLANDQESTLFVACVQFALLCMAMGFGQFPPLTHYERLVALVCFVANGCLYAYVIGAVCGVVSSQDPASAEFQASMDLLNQYMSEHRLAPELCLKIRHYLIHKRKMMRETYYKDVLKLLSPCIQAEVAEQTHLHWIASITYFCVPDPTEMHAFVAAIATKLGPQAYIPNEGIYMEGALATTMHVVERGIASVDARIMSHGKAFGHEMIMQNGVRQHCAVAMTYCDCFTLTHKNLYHVLECGGAALRTLRHQVRKEAIRLSLRQAIKEIAAASRVNKGHDAHHKVYTEEQVKLRIVKLKSQARQKSLLSGSKHLQHMPLTAAEHRTNKAGDCLSFWLNNKIEDKDGTNRNDSINITPIVEGSGATDILHDILGTLNLLVKKVNRLEHAVEGGSKEGQAHDLSHHIRHVTTSHQNQKDQRALKKGNKLPDNHHYMM